MRSRRLLVLSVLACVASLQLASAEHEVGDWGCAPHVTEASAANPHLNDPPSDWNGELGRGVYYGQVPGGDIYREGTDIRKAWLGSDPQGNIVANVQIAGLLANEPNVVVRLAWDYDAGDELTVKKWVGARMKGYGVEYNFGYITQDGVAGARQFITLGATTGSITTGTPGLVSIVVPSDGQAEFWGRPAAGSLLTNVVAETSVIAGSPEPLPPPSPVRHGVSWLADTTLDGRTCDAMVA